MEKSEVHYFIMKRLPDAEFEIMKAVWNITPPFNVNMVLEQLNGEKDWKVQTAISLMFRLVKRGFLQTEKNGNERIYYSLISKEEYLKSETNAFIKQYHDDSIYSIFNTLYDSNKISENDIKHFLELIKHEGGKEC